RRRSDELHSSVCARFREASVFRKKSVAGMNRVGSAAEGDVNDALNVEIRLACSCRSDVVRLVCLHHMQGRAVYVRKHCYRWNAKLAAGTNHANSDFATIGDENFL